MKKCEMTPEHIRQFATSLKKFQFFNSLVMKDLDLILGVTHLYEFNSGDTIFKKGDVGDALYVVQSGECKVKQKGIFFLPEKTVATLKPGDVFGEMALLDQPYRTATVKTAGPTHLFVLLASNFNEILRQNPEFSKSLSQMAKTRKFEIEHR